jgi:uncharacterized membrane protein YuzA (DUF378 family)
MGTAETFTKIIKIGVAIIEVLLGLNVVLRLFGALPTFVIFEWVYNLSLPFKSPFDGTFAPIVLSDRFILDLSAIFAMIAYLVIGMILIWIINFIFKSESHK